jgi:two-component system, NarL family, nitrate/nitrite response regulator NarL
VINIAAVEDNRILVDSLRAWASGIPDIRLIAITPTVGDLLRAVREPLDVVLLDAVLRAEPDPAVNARRLLDAGYRVLVVDGSSELGSAARILAAGVHGYLTRDHDLEALGQTLRAIAFGGTAWSLGPTAAAVPDGHPVRPLLSEREHAVLMAYASGRTLDSVARYLGISVETAKTYLKRIKAKYQEAGLPVHTKLDLAEQVRADCAGGTCPRPSSRAGSPGIAGNVSPEVGA